MEVGRSDGPKEESTVDLSYGFRSIFDLYSPIGIGMVQQYQQSADVDHSSTISSYALSTSFVRQVLRDEGAVYTLHYSLTHAERSQYYNMYIPS